MKLKRNRQRKFRFQETSELLQYVVKIQKVIRGGLCRRALRRQATVAAETPERFVCPITLQIFERPSIASDGYTYETDAIQRVLGSSRLPFRGPMGRDITHANLCPNLMLLNEINEWRRDHDMEELPTFVIAAPTHPQQQAPAPQPAQQRQRQAPQRPAAPQRTPLTLRDAYNMSLSDLVRNDYFLNEFRRPGLCQIYNAARVQNGYGVHCQAGAETFTKQRFVDLIQRWVNRDGADLTAVLKLFDREAFLNTTTETCLHLLLSSIHISTSSSMNKNGKIHAYLMHRPITIQVVEKGMQKQMTVKRCFSVQLFYAELYNASHQMVVDLETPFDSADRMCCTSLGNLNVKEDSVVVIDYTQPVTLPAPRSDALEEAQLQAVAHASGVESQSMGSDEYQIFVKDLQGQTITILVKSTTSVLDLKRKIYGTEKVQSYLRQLDGVIPLPDELRLLYRGKQLDDPQAIMDNLEIKKECTVHLILRLRGGMPKRGVKKITKAEKVHLLRARATFASANLTQQPMQIVQAITNDPHFVTNAVNNLAQQQNGLAQLRELKNKMDTVARWDQLVDQLPQYLIPQVAQMKQQRDDINKALEAFDAAVEAVFADQFYENNGYNTDGLYTQIEGHITALERAEIAAQAVAAAQGNNNDAAMGN